MPSYPIRTSVRVGSTSRISTTSSDPGAGTTAGWPTRCSWSASTRRGSESVFEAGQASDRAGERGHVVVAVAFRDQSSLELGGQGTHRQDGTELRSHVEA